MVLTQEPRAAGRKTEKLKKTNPHRDMSFPAVGIQSVQPEVKYDKPVAVDHGRTPLRRRFSKLTILPKRDRSGTWRQQIEETAHGLMPVPMATDVFSLYPWAALRRHTDVLVAKSKVTDDERELMLLNLIEAHENKVLALSACSHLLSQQHLYDILGEFARHADTALYLQAFVAAAHGNYLALSQEDEAWAATLVSSQRDVFSHTPNMESIQALFELMGSRPLPRDAKLREKALSLIINVCTTLNVALDACERTKDWIRAEPVAAALSNLLTQRELSSYMMDMLTLRVPSWQHWARWKPNKDRHRLWLESSTAWPNPMWDLLSPDLTRQKTIYPTSLERIIAEGRLHSWLQQSHIILGPGLLFDDRRSGMEEFMKDLFPVLDRVCQHGGIHAAFFRHLLLDPGGLDTYTLALWRAAEASLFNDHASFLEAVLRGGFGREHSMRDVVSGLGALDTVVCDSLRKYLRQDLQTAVRKAANDVRASFMKLLGSRRDWLPAASALEYFRTHISNFAWLNEISVRGLNMQHTIDVRSLEGLNQLYRNLRDRDSELLDDAGLYIQERVLGLRLHEWKASFNLIHTLHRASGSAEHCRAALTIALVTEIPLADRSRLILDLPILTPSKVSKLETCLIQADALPAARVCQRIVRLSARILQQQSGSHESWLLLVLYVLDVKHNLDVALAFLQRSFTNCNLKKYRSWLENLQIIFGESLPGLLDACVWVKKLSAYSHVLKALRSLPNSTNALHYMFVGSHEPQASMILRVLQSIQDEADNEKKVMKQHMALAFTLDKENSEAVSQAIVLLSKVSQKGVSLCQKLVAVSVQESKEVARVQLDIWTQTLSTSDRTTRTLLTCLGKALHLPAGGSTEVAKDYFAQRVAALIAEAKALEEQRGKLRQKDRRGVTAVMVRLGVEDSSSAMENELDDMPADLRSHVEVVDDNTLELQFPLDHLSDLKRLAMGVQKGEFLVVRLHINSDGEREAFCAHVVDPTMDWQSIKHKPLNFLKTANPPNRLLCEGSRDTRLGYVVMRRAFESFKTARNKPSLRDIYKGFSKAIALLGSDCVVCAKSLDCSMHRSVVCLDPKCQQLWLQTSLEVRLADLRLNGDAVELLLAAIYAAASTTSLRNLDLLPNCPSRLNDHSRLLLLLDTIPAISTFDWAVTNLASIKDRYCLRAELLLSWACNSFRGYLAEAIGSLKIPNMPGVKQFVLADSAPEITAAFARWDSQQPRQALFHGTSYDRLYAILNQGLIVLSNTSLQAHGAASGAGIYLAEQPSLSLSYAGAMGLNTTFAQQHTDVVNRTVLLGIEYAGNDASRGNGIHVAPDSTKCCVR